jgi:hypothetical protein
MSKLFKCAGVSTRNGVTKARFASDMTRVKVLAKTGSKDIDMIELKEPMTKEDAVAFLLKINFDNGNKIVREALENDLAKRQPQAASKDKPKKEAKKAPKPKAPKAKSTPSLDAIRAKAKVEKSTITKAEVTKQLADLEDAPF